MLEYNKASVQSMIEYDVLNQDFCTLSSATKPEYNFHVERKIIKNIQVNDVNRWHLKRNGQQEREEGEEQGL